MLTAIHCLIYFYTQHTHTRARALPAPPKLSVINRVSFLRARCLCVRVCCMCACLCVRVCVSVCVLESSSWCGDYCFLLAASIIIIVVLTVVTLSVYFLKSRRAAAQSGALVSCCWTTNRHHRSVRSGVSAEYAFATASSELTVDYRPTTSDNSGVLVASPDDWYHQQLTTLLQASCRLVLSFSLHSTGTRVATASRGPKTVLGGT